MCDCTDYSSCSSDEDIERAKVVADPANLFLLILHYTKCVVMLNRLS